jgi:hypothetical protein
MDIPLHTARLVERVLGSYCERICPPTARHAVQLDWRIAADTVTLLEVRLFCGVPGAHRHVPIAQFRYHAPSGAWRLFHCDEQQRWRRTPGRPATRHFIELLRAVDGDAAGLFWGRIDGKSLRWCSPRGRCPGCEQQYCRILGGTGEPQAGSIVTAAGRFVSGRRQGF